MYVHLNKSFTYKNWYERSVIFSEESNNLLCLPVQVLR